MAVDPKRELIHDLRNRVAVIAGYVQLLMRHVQRTDVDLKRVERHTQLIHAQTAQLADVAARARQLEASEPPAPPGTADEKPPQ